jgi:hypothetical protein
VAADSIAARLDWSRDGLDWPNRAASRFIEASASFGSLQQWMSLQRQVLRAGPIASLDIIAISTDAARLRLGLRVPQGDAPSALLSSGVVLTPPARPGDIWRVGLGDG